MLLRNVMEKKKCEELFEDALGNVGFSIDSGVLWRKYLDYISEIRDPTRLLSLRRIYQRALSIPMDSIDVIWAEYEKLERSAGEHLADQLLPEYLGKSTQAKRVYRDRKKLLASCDMARLAVPPSSNPSEHAQLDAWNKIFKYDTHLKYMQYLT
jgi:cleavage stimulation factor subunit 3